MSPPDRLSQRATIVAEGPVEHLVPAASGDLRHDPVVEQHVDRDEPLRTSWTGVTVPDEATPQAIPERPDFFAASTSNLTREHTRCRRVTGRPGTIRTADGVGDLRQGVR